MKYFAYGSNCNPAVMRQKDVGYRARASASLRGYRLRFNKKALRALLPSGIGFANINEHPGEAVEGILYDIEGEHLERLDASERHPRHYARIEVTVDTRQGPQPCFAYQARPDKIAHGLRPTRDYLDHILAARAFLSRSYHAALARSPTYQAECALCRSLGEVVFVHDNEGPRMVCLPCGDGSEAVRTD
ncbi:MAG: gamma-glutamylcyclotransferase family protein [Planctomycetota bacterium]|jgi:gamma-glutamylcyclotransferase (GGCT)/AIG2-like uncharacterized protein YtfP